MEEEDISCTRINITDGYSSGRFSDADQALVDAVRAYCQRNDMQVYLDGSAIQTSDYNDIDLVTEANCLVDRLAGDATKAHPGNLESSLKDMAAQLELSYIHSDEHLKSVTLAGPTVDGVAATNRFRSPLGPYVESVELDGGCYTGTDVGDVYLQDHVNKSSPVHLSFERLPKAT